MRKDRINTNREFRDMAVCRAADNSPLLGRRGNEEAPFFGWGYLQRQIKHLRSKNGSRVATAMQKKTF